MFVDHKHNLKRRRRSSKRRDKKSSRTTHLLTVLLPILLHPPLAIPLLPRRRAPRHARLLRSLHPIPLLRIRCLIVTPGPVTSSLLTITVLLALLSLDWGLGLLITRISGLLLLLLRGVRLLGSGEAPGRRGLVVAGSISGLLRVELRQEERSGVRICASNQSSVSYGFHKLSGGSQYNLASLLQAVNCRGAPQERRFRTCKPTTTLTQLDSTAQPPQSVDGKRNVMAARNHEQYTRIGSSYLTSVPATWRPAPPISGPCKKDTGLLAGLQNRHDNISLVQSCLPLTNPVGQKVHA